MKVAICMRGAVSTYKNKSLLKNHGYFANPGEIYDNKNYINIHAVQKAIQFHIIQTNPRIKFDFFLHGWNQDLQETFIKMYQPKSFLFEDNMIYKKEILEKCAYPSCYSGPSQLLSIKKSIELKEAYEVKNNFKYDAVILYRYDVLLWKDIILSNYDLSKQMYSSSYIYPFSVGDFHFIMNHNQAFLFKGCYDWLSKSNTYNNYIGLNPHYLLYNYITNVIKLKVKTDGIMPAFDQDVIRKIHPSIIKNLLPYGITTKDLIMSISNTHIYFLLLTLYLVCFMTILLYVRYKNVYHTFFYFILLLTLGFLLHFFLNVKDTIIVLLFIFVFIYKSNFPFIKTRLE